LTWNDLQGCYFEFMENKTSPKTFKQTQYEDKCEPTATLPSTTALSDEKTPDLSALEFLDSSGVPQSLDNLKEEDRLKVSKFVKFN